MTSRTPKGFTLAELIVVVAIIALLVTIIAPSLTTAFAVARQSICANNLRQIRVAISTLRSRDQMMHTGELTVDGWRAQLLAYDSNSTDLMVCPEGYNLATNWKDDDVLSKYALKTLSGSNFLYNMILAPGPACRKENVTNGGKKYDLSFEDQRTASGQATGDLSYNNPTITITIMGQNAKVTVKGGGGGYHWSLVDTTNDKVYLNDILKAPGAMPGDSVILKGAISLGGKFSYGLNSVVNDMYPTASKILALDYPEDVAHIAGTDEVHDNWMQWLGADGKLSFARHMGRCNVAMVDGSVKPMYPRDIDPTNVQLLDKYWKP